MKEELEEIIHQVNTRAGSGKHRKNQERTERRRKKWIWITYKEV